MNRRCVRVFIPLALALTAAGGARERLQTLLVRGYRLERENKNVEALAAFHEVLKVDPGDHAAFVELGYLNCRLKLWRSAVKYLKAASEQDPDNLRLRLDLGYASASAG